MWHRQRELNKEKTRRRKMNHNTTTQLEYDQALYIDKLESTLDEISIQELKEDRRYIIEVAKLLHNPKHGFTAKELKVINKNLIDLI